MNLSGWRRLFRRSDAISEAIERAVEEQAAFERVHPVRFDPDQRAQALRQRFVVHYGAAAPQAAITTLTRAALEWAPAAQAAEEAP